ncbi:MAG: hypothetical protein O7E56_14975 [SAR324 cluster bacterium]|nr:hypothetical protein [SAR324 cluster bacterium]MCZ6730561.1 hypothetical protein [SAR324 cluster bacterium]
MTVHVSHPTRMRELRRALRLYLLVFALIWMLGGCSIYDYLFGDDGLKPGEEPSDPFAEGMLNAIGQLAPSRSPSQFLAGIAGQLGWEDQVTRNTLLRKSVEDEKFSESVEPFLLSLFFKHGFSVLPNVGKGHQFARDSLVRGDVGPAKFLVTTREKIRLIFVKSVANVQIVYPKDGSQPQIFALDDKGIISVRGSLLNEYLR